MSINTYADYERSMMRAAKAQDDADVLRCPKCKFTFFEEVKLTQYLADHLVILGQQVPQKPQAVPFLMLRCGKCNELTEPRLQRNTRDYVNKKYDEFLDQMEEDAAKKPNDPNGFKIENI